MAYITTHKELSKLNGRKITCKIQGVQVNDAIILKKKGIYVLQSIVPNLPTPKNSGYKYELQISNAFLLYQQNNRGCVNIEIIEG